MMVEVLREGAGPGPGPGPDAPPEPRRAGGRGHEGGERSAAAGAFRRSEFSRRIRLLKARDTCIEVGFIRQCPTMSKVLFTPPRTAAAAPPRPAAPRRRPAAPRRATPRHAAPRRAGSPPAGSTLERL